MQARLFHRLTANLINLRDLKHLNLSWNQMNVIEEELLSNISYLYHNGSLKSVRLQGMVRSTLHRDTCMLSCRTRNTGDSVLLNLEKL